MKLICPNYGEQNTPNIFVTCFVWLWNGTSYSEEHNLQVIENKVLRKIYGPKNYEVSNLGYYLSDTGRLVLLR